MNLSFVRQFIMNQIPTAQRKAMNASNVTIVKNENNIITYEDQETKKQVRSFDYKSKNIDLGYETRDTSFKTVLVIGDSRIGKSQLVKNILNPGNIEQMEVYAVTAEPIDYTISIVFEGCNMTIDFIDSPGFNEKTEKAARSNQKLEKVIADKLRAITTKIDVILVVVSKLDDDAIKAITMCLKMFGVSCSKNMYLLFTHFEGLYENEEADIIKQFKGNKKFVNLTKYFDDRILFTGCISLQMTQSNDLMEKATKQQVERNKKILRVIKDSEPIYLKDLGTSVVTNKINPKLTIEQAIEKQTILTDMVSDLTKICNKVIFEITKNCSLEKKGDSEIFTIGKLSTVLKEDEINRVKNIYQTALNYIKESYDDTKDITELSKLTIKIDDAQKLAEDNLELLLKSIQKVYDRTQQLDKVMVDLVGFNERYDQSTNKPKDTEGNGGFIQEDIPDL